MALGCLSLAQQDVFHSRITMGAGLAGLRGDIDGGIATESGGDVLTGGLAFERFLGHGTSLRFGLDRLVLSGNDLESGRADRALNFRTEVQAVQLGLRFYADNGHLLNYDARLAPFIGIGVGVGSYRVMGDLFGPDGVRYHYWSDGRIMDQAEFGPLAGDALPIAQDGDYETDLTHLATETGKPADPTFLFIPATVGLKWRISQRLSAELAFAYQWTFTDRLDDVSGEYPDTYANEDLALTSNPTGRVGPRGDASTNDHIVRASFGISYSFGRRSWRYRMPPMHAVAWERSGTAQAKEPPTEPTTTAVEKDTLTDRPLIIRVERIEVGTLFVDSLIIRGSDGGAHSVATAPPTKQDTLRAEHGASKLGDRAHKTPLDSVPASGTRTAITTRSRVVALMKDSAVVDTAIHLAPAIPAVHTDSGKVAAPRELRDRAVVKDTLGAATDKPSAPIDTTRTAPKPRLPETAPAAEPAAPKEEGRTRIEEENRALRARNDSLERLLSMRPASRPAAAPQPPAGEGTAPEAPTVIKERVVPIVVPVTVPAAKNHTNTIAQPAAQPEKPAPKAAWSQPATVKALTTEQRVAQGRLDSTTVERLHTIELFIKADSLNASREIDSLRTRIAALDARLDSLRRIVRSIKTAQLAAPATSDTSSNRPLRKVAVADTFHFDLGSARVRLQDRKRIVDLAKRIATNEVQRVLVTGHSDGSGRADYNLRLTQQRADAVAAILRESGVPADHIQAKGLGEKLARTRFDPDARFVAVQFVVEVRE